MSKIPFRLFFTKHRPWARPLSTATKPVANRTPTSPQGQKPLYRRLSALGATKGRTVKSTLDAYTKEGNNPTSMELIRCVKELRRYKRFDHALQIIEWMEGRNMKLGFKEHAIHIDLISRNRGLPTAEDYFAGLSFGNKNWMTYGSLLNCYCRDLMDEKALGLFRKMGELRFLNSPMPFTILMAMYLRLGQPEEVLLLVKEMKLRRISLDSYAYSMWMQSYASMNDVHGVEIVVKEMQESGGDDWMTYCNLAAIYVKAGKFQRAETALRMLEAEMPPNNRDAHHFFITLYAGTSNLSQVHRVWELLMSSFGVTTNISYLVLIPALAKLRDVGGLKKWYGEWESNCHSYDIRIPNSMIKAYLELDMYEEAVSVFDGAMSRSKVNLFKAREMFMIFLVLKSCRLDLALDHLKAALSEGEKVGEDWQPNQGIVDAFFSYFEEAKDVDGAEKFSQVLKLTNCMDSHAYNLLLKTYVAADKLDPGIRWRLEENNIEISPELESLLDKVSPF